MGAKTFVVTHETWEEEVLNSDTPVLVDFWAEWCGPCKMIAPLVDQLAEKYDGKLRVAKVDADENQELLMHYGIMGIPTLLLIKGGEVAERIVGYRPLPALEPQITKHLD